MAHEFEALVVEQMGHVAAPAREVVVDAEHLVAGGQEPLAEMRAEETGAAGDEDAFGEGHGMEAPEEPRLWRRGGKEPRPPARVKPAATSGGVSGRGLQNAELRTVDHQRRQDA